MVERPTSADGRRGEEIDPEMMQKLESLETKNAELREKLSSVEEEKASIVQQERERIQHLAQEFENVRRELDQEMCRYDSEKKWLKSRIQNLEQDNKELQKQLEDKSSSQEKSKKLPIIAILDPEEDKPAGLIRKTLSEPELVYEDEEISRLKAENSRLMGYVFPSRPSLTIPVFFVENWSVSVNLSAEPRPPPRLPVAAPIGVNSHQLLALWLMISTWYVVTF